ncbi:CGNR zinc finger domain-containing protein [Herbidospora yilanensis]|uniref:CGNR zinc finger domain-containing protein n=1 Tax=Herbidospora yilanensis TaxID=354426 RepID=UPI000AEC3DC6|nr:CGNR zinc finger domain-containing protein [Herbidospora yilanensis]
MINVSGPAELLRDFVNTYDVETDTDDLTSPQALRDWLEAHGLESAADLALAKELREGLRAGLRHNHDAVAYPAPEPLETALTALPLRVTLDGGTPRLAPADGADQRGLAQLAAMIAAAHADGTWPRLKVCVESTCQAAFIDASKNRSRAWCSMRVCGNRTKTRTYRARRQAEGPGMPA